VRVLGVDPGLTRCGLGVVDGAGGRTVRCVAVDVVRTPADAPIAERLLAVGAVVEGWIERYRPDVVAIERVFSQHNVRTVMGTAQASGVVALLAARAGLPVAFHTPSEVKAAVTGEGRAGKEQVTTMVTRLLRLTEAPRPADAADALALAICHCWRAPMLDRMAQAQARSAELARAHEVGGVGLAVHATPTTLAGLRRGQPSRLATALVVREDSLTLFGFADDEERELFGLLQTVSGIGPRTALATLAVLAPDVLRRALVDGDLTTITRVPGIGRKGAERLVLELRDKVVASAAAPAAMPSAALNGTNPRRDQVVEALVGLGFTAKPAEQAVDAVLAGEADADASTLLRAALTRLGRSR
jgi:crossover junction endodeoxyribonuclease RuvC/Holliday junction DNA helicase RuvA subunit